MAKLGIDVDGVLADFCTGYNHLLQEQGSRPVVYNCWDWDKAAGFTSEERGNAWKVIKETDFWFNLYPLPGAEADMERLGGLAEDHDIYFITHRQGKECKQQTEDWLFRYGIACPTVLISTDDKRPLISGLDLDFYIDDKLSTIENADLLRQYGLKLFLLDRPYNQCGPTVGFTRVNTVSEGLNIYGI